MNLLEVINNPALIGSEQFRETYRNALSRGIDTFSDWMNRSFPIGKAPVASITLGSGLGPMVDELELCGEPLPFEDVGIPKATAFGHEGRFLAGMLEGVPVILQQGRVHLYEGHTGAVAALSTRIQCNVGIRNIILTNAAGSLDPQIKERTLVLVTGGDSLTLDRPGNPSTGLSGDLIGEQFYAPPLGYSDKLLKAFLAARSSLGMDSDVNQGVYVYRPGPNYEDPSDIWDLYQKRLARLSEGKFALAPAAVGMSTLPEIFAIAQYNAGKSWNDIVHCIAISNITNLACGLGGSIPTHKEVIENAKEGGLKTIALCNRVFPNL